MVLARTSLSQEKPPGRDESGRFVAGTSGNPSGKSKTDTALADIANQRSFYGDGWASALTGIGTEGRDKRLSHSFTAPALTYQEIVELWGKDDMASAAIEMPGKECFREGYEITIGDEGNYGDLKEDIEEKLIELGVDEALERGMSLERAFGGAAVLLGADDHRPLHTPLLKERVTSLDWINVLEPMEIYPVAFYDDPSAPMYGEPKYYEINNFGRVGQMFGTARLPVKETPKQRPTSQIIHESRLIEFKGIETSRYAGSVNPIAQNWGLGVMPRFIEILRDFNVFYHAVSILGTDVGQPVISIEGLMQLVAKSPDKVQARMAALNLGRSTARAILLDAKEKFDRQTTNLTGIPELLDRLSRRLSAAVGIPLSILLGFSPDGMGKSSETELEQWHNIVRSIQRRRLTPVLRMIVEMIIRTLRQRKIPKKWGIRWNELKRLTDAQRAEARLTQARADEIYVQYGIVDPNEIRLSRFGGEYSYETQVDESKDAPGFVAPLPAGVVPNGASGAAPGGPAGGGAAAAKPGVHGVSTYVRRNPAVGTHSLGDHADEDGPGRIREYAGFRVVVESPKGSYRYWTDTDGTPGKTKMRYDYGYIEGTMGNDGDSLDVYLGPNESAEWVYIVHQNRKPDFTQFDEDKCMLGLDSANHAKDAYLSQFDDERFFGGMTVMSMADFREKVKKHCVGRLTHAQLDGMPTIDDTEDAGAGRGTPI